MAGGNEESDALKHLAGQDLGLGFRDLGLRV